MFGSLCKRDYSQVGPSSALTPLRNQRDAQFGDILMGKKTRGAISYTIWEEDNHCCILFLKIISGVCVCVCVHKDHSTRVEVRGQLLGIGSLLLPCGYRDSNTGYWFFCNCFYPMGHFAGPLFLTIISKFIWQLCLKQELHNFMN